MTKAQSDYIRQNGENLTMHQMARELHCTYDMVRRECAKLNITPTKSYWQKEGFVPPPFHYDEPMKASKRPATRYDNPSHDDIINKYLSMDV